MRYSSYLNKRDPKTRRANEPTGGTEMMLAAATLGHRSIFQLIAPNGWSSLHPTRRDALDFAQRYNWRINASMLDEVVS
jgi:hypothetical protein